MADKKVALVIGSGSVKCAAALGLMKVLERENINVDMVVGCSGGSIYAACIALGWSTQQATDATLRLWTKEVTAGRNWSAYLQLVGLRPFNERFGLVNDALIMRRLRQAFGDVHLGDTKIPLYITATDFYNGEQEVMHGSRYSLQDALRASISIPYIFAPHKIGERYFVDGYLSDPLPVGVAIREGADVIIAIGFESPYQTRVSSILRYAFEISSITSNNLLQSNFAFHNLAHHSEIIPIMPEFEHRIHLFDTDKIPYVIEVGERATEEQLPYIRKLLEA
ncbi:MAG: patatin-like phospholipase family protein [Anaerolineales bacterium]